jgi:ppGpp synthetase/RelA/SpoT-type nucleotidyltranferase
MPRSLSKTQTDRLGRRLRAEAIPDPDDLAELQRVRADCDDVLHSIASILQGDLGLKPSRRVKTVQTIIEKLQRSPTMALSRMQDIAGARVVVDGTRSGQDHVVQQICSRFAAKKVYDRRAAPSHGYRAVHVVVEHDDCLVEIQVRTRRQDTWAQFFERLADRWGRQIRYGQPPDHAEHELAAGVTRAAFVEMLHKVAGYIDEAERWEVRLEELQRAQETLRAVEMTDPVSSGDDPARLTRTIAVLEEVCRDIRAWLNERGAHLDAIEALLDSAIQHMTDEGR